MKNAVFWDVIPCGSCKKRHFGGKYRFHHQDDKNRRTRKDVSLLHTGKVIPSSLILATLITEAISSSETSVLKTATRCNMPQDGILHSTRRENLKSYVALTGWTL
jgi:hypothetical protein